MTSPGQRPPGPQRPPEQQQPPEQLKPPEEERKKNSGSTTPDLSTLLRSAPKISTRTGRSVEADQAAHSPEFTQPPGDSMGNLEPRFLGPGMFHELTKDRGPVAQSTDSGRLPFDANGNLEPRSFRPGINHDVAALKEIPSSKQIDSTAKAVGDSTGQELRHAGENSADLKSLSIKDLFNEQDNLRMENSKLGPESPGHAPLESRISALKSEIDRRRGDFETILRSELPGIARAIDDQLAASREKPFGPHQYLDSVSIEPYGETGYQVLFHGRERKQTGGIMPMVSEQRWTKSFWTVDMRTGERGSAARVASRGGLAESEGLGPVDYILDAISVAGLIRDAAKVAFRYIAKGAAREIGPSVARLDGTAAARVPVRSREQLDVGTLPRRNLPDETRVGGAALEPTRIPDVGKVLRGPEKRNPALKAQEPDVLKVKLRDQQGAVKSPPGTTQEPGLGPSSEPGPGTSMEGGPRRPASRYEPDPLFLPEVDEKFYKAVIVGEKEVAKRLAQGNLGEKLTAELLGNDGHRIIMYKPRAKDTNQPGFDLVTIKGDKVYFIDNKALTTGRNESRVSALVDNFEKNRIGFLKDLEREIAKPDVSGQVNPVLQRAVSLIEKKEYVRVVTNAGFAKLDASLAKGVTKKLHDNGIHFWNVTRKDYSDGL